MGAKNAQAVFAMYPHLSHRAKLAAVQIALRTLDDDSPEGTPARTYFAGPGLIAEAIGYLPDENGEHTASTLRTVRRVLAELVAAGVLEHRKKGGNGRRAVYVLRCNPMPDGKGRGALTAPLLGGSDGPPEGGSHGPHRGAATAPPKRNEEPQRRNTEEEGGGESNLTCRDDSDDEDPYQKAYAELLHHPRQPELMAEAKAEGIDSARLQVIRAAEIARERRTAA